MQYFLYPLAAFFCVVFIGIGTSLVRFRSISQRMTAYEADPSKGTMTDGWFHGFRKLVHGRILNHTIDSYGDKAAAIVFRVMGGFFLLIGLFAVFSLLAAI